MVETPSGVLRNYLGKQTMQTTALDSAAIIATLKSEARWASREFIKNPNATRWIVQTRTAFVYQQAYYFFNSFTRSSKDKYDLLALLATEPTGNWGDLICKFVLGVSLAEALREFATCP